MQPWGLLEPQLAVGKAFLPIARRYGNLPGSWTCGAYLSATASRAREAFLFAYIMRCMTYQERVRALLTPPEKKLFSKLSTPAKIQDYLDTLPINFNIHGDTYMSPRRTIAAKTAHCAEGALVAAAALAFHGAKPLIMDLRAISIDVDVDHVVALYTRNGYWGAISKTNYPVLRYRDPVYPDIKTLALSYFHEYFLDSGKKTLREYSAAFNLAVYAPESWVTATGELDALMDDLDESRHFPLVPEKNRALLRPASKIEIKTTAAREWTKKGTRNP